MSAAIFDFETIAKHARLKALDGTPQNVVQPMGVDPGVAPVEFDGYGMYAGWMPNAETIAALNAVQAGITEAVADINAMFADTAPSEWSAPEQDPA